MRTMRKKNTRILRRVLAVVLAMVITIEILPMGAVNAYADTNGEPNQAKEDAYGMEYSDWLSYMPDDLPISRINMLASHDSGCYAPMDGQSIKEKIQDALKNVFGEKVAGLVADAVANKIEKYSVGMSQTQDLNIYDQLMNGARVLDIRGAYEHDYAEWLIVNHKVPMFKEKNSKEVLCFRDVFETIDRFLKKHPNETVILSLTSEGIPLDDIPIIKKMGLGEDRAQELIREFCNKDINNWPRFKYYKEGSPVPTLREARGKCIVLIDTTLIIIVIEKK